MEKHISNIYNSFELDLSTCALFAQVQKDENRKINIYNLDMILAVGYRVNSKRGILFRKWASSILKQYLLHGQVINEGRCLAHSDNIFQMNNTINNINELLNRYL